MGPMRGAGVALALSAASAGNTLLLLIFLRRNPQIAVSRAARSALGYTAKLIACSIIAAAPVRYLNPRLLPLFANRGRLIACGIPLAINAIIFGTIGIMLLFITKDRQVRALRGLAGRSKTGSK